MRSNLISMIIGLGLATASQATTFGPVENFDVVNDTGSTAHGFEIELDDLQQSEITSIFGDASRWPDMERYGAPTVVEYPDPTSKRTGKSVKITYQATYNGTWSVGTPSGTLPVSPSDSCWPYGAPTYGPDYPCDHFGVSTSIPAANVKYSWLLEATPGSSNLVYQAAGVPAPQWNVVPQAPINNVPQPPKVNVVIAAPKPQHYEFGEARWVKVTATGTLKDVAVEDLMAEGKVIKDAKTQTQVEWQLLQVDAGNPGSGQVDLTGVALDKDATGVVYRFEFYKYTGAHDPQTYEAKAKTSDTPQQPDPADLGPFIVAQMAGINFDGQVPPLPAPPAAPAINASIPDAVLSISYSAKIDASASDPADILTYSVTGLPAGLSVDGSTGIISGQVDDPGLVDQVFTLNINVADITNGTNTAISTPFSVVYGQITLTAGDQIGTVGQAFAYHLSATGGTGVFEYSLIGGALPDGLALDALTGIISGSPTTVGTSAVTLLAIDSLGYGSDYVPLNITINDAAPVVPDVVACSGTNEVMTNAANVRAAIVETRGGPNNGGPAIQIAKATTTIVPPLDLNTFFAGGNLITYSGTLAQGVCVSDTTTIAQGLTLANVPAQTVNYATAITPVPVVISGGVAPYTISVGNLPLGFSLAGTDIVGSSTWVGTTAVTLSVNDSNGQSTYQTFNFTVNPPAGIVLGATNVPTTGQVGIGFTGSVSATGGYGPLNWTGTGLPTGVSISAAGILSGTPSVSGAFNPVLRVTDGAGQVVTVNASVVIAAAPVVNPPPAASCTVPKGAIKSATKSVITAVNGTTLSTQAGTTLSILPCATIQWNRTSRVYRVGDRIEWKGWKDGAVVDVYNATLN